jgi:hypothetical protein
MAYSLSFSEEFFTGTEDRNTSEPNIARPTCVWDAIYALKEDKERWAEMCYEEFGEEDPELVSVDAVLEKIRANDTCDSLTSPIDVYIDDEGFFEVTVYDERKSDPIRHVKFDGFELKLWDSGKVDGRGQSKLGYQFSDPDGVVIFDANDFAGSPMHADDSDATLRSLVTFLTLRKGDTDRSYFKDYNERQIDFRDTKAESLSLWATDGDDALEFENCDGYEPPDKE